MGFRDRLDGATDRVASAVSSLFVTAPDHPNRGGNTGESPGVERRTDEEPESAADEPADGNDGRA